MKIKADDLLLLNNFKYMKSDNKNRGDQLYRADGTKPVNERKPTMKNQIIPGIKN